MPRIAVLIVLAGLALALAGGSAGRASAAPATAATPDETALAQRFAPVVRLRIQDSCEGKTAPYLPVDVDTLMGNDEVALRGPWNGSDLVAVGPTAADLARGLWEYHLDFPGDALDPGCTYEEWAARVQAQAPPTTYARVVTQAGHPGRLALQYWFFYVYNDWKNKHEGDWEMIQLDFDAATPGQALGRTPVDVGYSQHSSAEGARWGDEKLQVVDGTHPVVYPAEGSQANFYESRLYLMRSSAEGVGCDDTQGPSEEIRPEVAVVPTAREDYLREYPWLGFDGRWGERQRGVFNGPTGPADKLQWTEPFTWAATRWRAESFAVPGAGTAGTSATDLFCGAIAAGSEFLRQAKLHPGASVAIIGGLAVLLLWGISRTRWVPSAPLRVARRRAWGQMLSASRQMMRRHPRALVGLGLLFIPLGVLITLVQWLVFQVTLLAPLVDEAGTRNAFVDVLVVGIGLTFTLLGYALVQAAAAHTLLEIDAGRPVTAITAYRAVLPRLRGLVPALITAVVVMAALQLTVVLAPAAVFVMVRWSLIGSVAAVEGGGGVRLLRRSAALARGAWWRVAGVALGVTAVALLLGPAIGVLVLLGTGAAFNLVNMIAALVYVLALPFAATATAYLYFDLRVREALEPRVEERGSELPGELPAAGV